MPLRIYNSLTRSKQEFIPLQAPRVLMYVCGPTVYDDPHIGHVRSAYVFDVIRRYLEFRQYRVTLVRNVTDVDDKIIDKARRQFPGEDLNAAVEKVSRTYLEAYHGAMEQLGIRPPDHEPKATAFLTPEQPLMQQFIGALIQKGAAYAAAGDVYFDITRAPGYGKLSGQSPEKMESGSRVAPGENKRNPLDFALWKKAKEGEPSWESPWGRGRPGWHIECSVMSSHLLGDVFDIHGGGLDLIFPHHENEIAQSEAAGKQFARYWIHHGLLTINGQKMSKSLGNFVTVKDFLSRQLPVDALKLFFLQTHYSQPLDFTWEIMEEKRRALYTITRFLETVEHIRKDRTWGMSGAVLNSAASAKDLEKNIEGLRVSFDTAMDDDFNTPNAVAACFEIIRVCNVIYSTAYDEAYLPVIQQASDYIAEMLSVLGLTLTQSPLLLPKEQIESFIDLRAECKRQKAFVEADKIRKELEEKGIILEDRKDGTTVWRRKG